MKDRWVRSYNVFDEKGRFKSKTVTYSIDGIEWNTFSHYYSVYKYAENNPNSNEQIEKSNTKVYATQGEITVVAEKNATANVYDISGQLIKRQNIYAGTNHINVSKGFYIVTIDRQSFKVLTK